MNHVNRFLIVCCIAAVCMAAQWSSAQVLNPLVEATFSGEVALPNATLPAGTYKFEIKGGTTVAVFNEQARLITIIPVRSVTRAKPGSLVVLDGSSGITRVAAVYADGKTTGYAFRYKNNAGPSSVKQKASPPDVRVTEKK